MKVYKIWCEWDMGFWEAYISRELAQKAIDETDWKNTVGRSQEIVEQDGLAYIEEIEVFGGE